MAREFSYNSGNRSLNNINLHDNEYYPILNEPMGFNQYSNFQVPTDLLQGRIKNNYVAYQSDPNMQFYKETEIMPSINLQNLVDRVISNETGNKKEHMQISHSATLGAAPSTATSTATSTVSDTNKLATNSEASASKVKTDQDKNNIEIVISITDPFRVLLVFILILLLVFNLSSQIGKLMDNDEQRKKKYIEI